MFPQKIIPHTSRSYALLPKSVLTAFFFLLSTESAGEPQSGSRSLPKYPCVWIAPSTLPGYGQSPFATRFYRDCSQFHSHLCVVVSGSSCTNTTGRLCATCQKRSLKRWASDFANSILPDTVGELVSQAQSRNRLSSIASSILDFANSIRKDREPSKQLILFVVNVIGS